MPSVTSLITKFDDAAGTCEVQAVSILSGKIHTKTMKMIREDFVDWQQRGVLIQIALPHLTPSEREFLLTGSTDAEWDENFKEEEQ